LNYRFFCSWKIDVIQPKFKLLSQFFVYLKADELQW
jgi:hypothetical protein